MDTPPVTPPTVVTTGYGPAALACLRRVVADAKATDPLAPATVIVGNNFVGIAARRSLAAGQHGPVSPGRSGIIGVDFVTTYRLAEQLGAGALAAAGRRPVSTPVLAAAVRRVLAEHPGLFGPVAEHPTTERRLVAAHRELSDLDEEQLVALSSQSRRAADVVAIHRRVGMLLNSNWFNEQDLLVAATAAIHRGEWDPSSFGSLILHLPQDISVPRARLLVALAGVVPCTVVTGLTGVDEADATVLQSLARLGCRAPVPEPQSVGPVQVLSVSDADDEVRHVVRGVVDAAREGVPFDRMAVVYATDQPYVRLLHDHLGGAGIAFNGAAVTSLAQSGSGRLLRRLLSLPDRGYRREDVAALLAGSPLRTQQGLVPGRAWEKLSRDAGVVKGRADWAHRLEAHTRGLQAELDRLGENPEWESRTERLRRQVQLSESFAAFMTALIDDLERGSDLDTWAERANWCRSLLRRHVGDQHDWPESERRDTDRVDAVLERLAGLDTVESSPSAAVFRRSLDLELEGGLGRVGSFGNGVLIGPAWMSVGLDLDRIWILGLSEGTFPSRPRDDSLLPDRERRAAGGLRLRSEQIGDEHRQFLAALAAVGPEQQAQLLRPRGDLRQSDERAPSRWLVDIAATTLGRRPSGAELDHLNQPWMRHVPSFAAGILAAPFPSTTQEYELKSLVQSLETSGLDQHPLLTDGPLHASVLLQRARATPAFTRFDGNLHHVGTPDPVAGPRATSATALETWARCPHAYFMRYLLRVEALETPELRIRIDPLSRGTLVHTILERFVQERIDHPVDVDTSGWSAADRTRLHTIADEEFDLAQARGLTGEALYWRRDRTLLRRDLDLFIDRDNERRIDNRLRPVATELAFGLGGAEPVAIALPDGRRLALRGSIDLVDEDREGNLLITDYKTGGTSNVSADDPHLGGTRLQLALYAIAARAVLDRPGATISSHYWHVRDRYGFKRLGYEVSPEVERKVLGAVTTIVDNIKRGVFPQHPEESTRLAWIPCAYCDPDGLGTAEARRRMLRKTSAAELQDYLVLAAPDLVPQATLPAIEDTA